MSLAIGSPEITAVWKSNPSSFGCCVDFSFQVPLQVCFVSLRGKEIGKEIGSVLFKSLNIQTACLLEDPPKYTPSV